MQSWQVLKGVPALLAAVACAMAIAGAAAQEVGTSVTVELLEFEGSGISGTAVLTETTAGGTHVSMQLRGQELDGNHPTHIHTGTCDNFNPNPLYPLETVNLSPVNREGLSESIVDDATIASLRGGDYVILVHQSPEELTNYLVCGEISDGTLGQAPLVPAAAGASTMHEMPEAGFGSAAMEDRSATFMIIALCALAALSALTAGALRRDRR